MRHTMIRSAAMSAARWIGRGDKNSADAAAVDDSPDMVLEDRQHDLVPQPRFGRVPVDVEVVGVGRGLPVREHLPPPGVRPDSRGW